MQTRKDLLQAHRLMTQRAGLALLHGEADTAEQPLRRINMGTFAGVMLAALVAAVFWIIGVFTHSGAQLQPNAANTVIMDKNTGQAYIWCQPGGLDLCPTANFASALLAVHSNKVKVRGVSEGSLSKFPPGPEVGIPGLPTPPVAANLVQGPWSVCLHTGLSPAGQQEIVTLVAGRSVGGQPITSGQAMLVRAQDQTWVIWNGQRMLITRRYVVGIGWGNQPTTDVPPAWLDSIKEGAAFAPPAVPNLGGLTAQGPLGEAPIGQVYQVQAVNGTQWFVQLSDGVASISKTQAALLQAEGRQVQAVSSQQINQHVSAQQVPGNGLPATVPTPVAYDTTMPLCSVYNGIAQAGEVTLNGFVPTGVTTQAASGIAVNDIWLPPGRGALVTVGQDLASPSFLITGARKYGLASQAVAGYLGYNLILQRGVVPANVVNLIPSGPALDPAQATQQLSG